MRKPKRFEYILYPSAAIIFVLLSWLVYRHIWLSAILATHPNLSADDRQAAHRAMPPLALIFLGLPVGMFIVLVLLIALRSVVSFNLLLFNVIAGLMILYPPFLLLRAMRADVSGRIFPSRSLATLFLAGAALLSAILLSICMGTAALLVRVLNTT